MALNIPRQPDKENGIAEMLSNLADKIELNRQTNQTLEQIAQAIFKSWFVDFEPVKAKIQAKRTLTQTLSQRERELIVERAAMCAISGKSLEELEQLCPETQQQLKTTAALFPDAMVESELGEVPEGWEVGVLDDLCTLNAKSWTKKNAPNIVWYVDLANTKNGVIEDTKFHFWGDAPSRARRVVEYGDTIIGTVRPGNRSYALIGATEHQLTVSTGFAVLSPKDCKFLEFIFIAATSDDNIDRLAHLADGGAYPAIRPDVVTKMQITIPNALVMSEFSKLTKPLFQKRDANLSAHVNLKSLRDTLLPKLLSGELTLSPAAIKEKAEKEAIGLSNA
jgi:type I restriction enzyme S subunit